jgi:hypothetical protein
MPDQDVVRATLPADQASEALIAARGNEGGIHGCLATAGPAGDVGNAIAAGIGLGHIGGA